ncbi:efflux RND transporter periplasmic adaptor subunit [Chitinophaga sp. 22536]|uniref:Efflux RND transporter periplasmic adaptor subunit n=2 Tax=Chitinophaga TaxID=79328 RepID=A0A847SD20_9BACT|nr:MULTISPECIES: efflux RND transporter periplasmic adaptor subunit [Chitinophaga]MBC9914492.1 efflux RND transporter periplasmic adaptor subunit [Chitinophaga varians]NLR78064.1 efflux RND transporter periplasmic adaptor subunit [Chitinophaga eiseniae]HVI44438.1 efflux RND transporter periplasmic adaptor subunit [Chitinophaga sp.]
MKQIQAFFYGTLLMTSCTQKPSRTTVNSCELHGDTVIINSQSALAKKIHIDTISRQLLRQQMSVAGVVKVIPNKFAEVAPTFSGRVLSAYLKLGMKVTPATPLFSMSSQDFITAQKAFFQAKEQLLLAEKRLARQRNLVANGVGVQRELEEAQMNYDVEKKEFESARLSIRLYKANPDELVLGQPLIIYAPITGEIVENKVVVGQLIKNDGASVASVAELSKVWVAGHVKEKDMGAIRQLSHSQITIAALPGKIIRGTIFHINELIEESSRSVEVLMECKNDDHALKPGMYVNVNFENTPQPTILISPKSLLQQSNTSFVFRQVAAGRYVRQQVETNGVLGNKVVVKSGLSENDTVISDGAYYLLDAR